MTIETHGENTFQDGEPRRTLEVVPDQPPPAAKSRRTRRRPLSATQMVRAVWVRRRSYLLELLRWAEARIERGAATKQGE